MVILSRHSLFHYFQYLVMNRGEENKFLDALRSGFPGMKVWVITQKTRNVLFEVELESETYVVKQHISTIERKKKVFDNEIKSTELAKGGFALPPLFMDDVSKLVIYKKYSAKSYLTGLRNVKEKIEDESLILFAEHTARFLFAFHGTQINNIHTLNYQDVLKSRSKVPEELKKEFIDFCMLWKSSGIIHGDLHGGNMFCDQLAQNIKLIDWETLCLGDPYYDLAIFFRFVVYTICGETFFNGNELENTHNGDKLKVYVKTFAQNYDSFCMPKMKIFFKVVNADFYSNNNFCLNIDYIFQQ